MNIFEVLNRWKSRLYEPRGKKFFDKTLFNSTIISDVSPEEPYNKSVSDIHISLLDKNNNESHRIIIENKIRTASASLSQLANYYKDFLMTGIKE